VARGIEKRVSRHIAQEVCPWNSPKLVQVSGEEDYRARAATSTSTSSGRGGAGSSAAASLPGTEAPSLVELMGMSYVEWDAWTRGSAIRRAGYAGFRRNVAVGLGNWLASVDEPGEAAVAVLRDALEDPEPLVREHAVWALKRSVR
jgi:epoxyqueuosine reductase